MAEAEGLPHRQRLLVEPLQSLPLLLLSQVLATWRFDGCRRETGAVKNKARSERSGWAVGVSRDA